MKSIKYILCFLGMGCFMGACEKSGGEAPNPYTPISLPHEFVERVENVNTAAFKIFGGAYNLEDVQTETSNTLVSTHGAFNLLAMLANGQNEEDRNQLIEFLWGRDADVEDLNQFCKLMRQSLPGVDRKVEYKESNAIWCDPLVSLSPSFLQTLVENYDASYFQTHPTAGAVNQWASEATNGMILDHVEDGQDLGLMCLATANYFAGEWKDKFDEEKTKVETFHNLDGTVSSVPFMHGSWVTKGYYVPELTAASLAFGNGNFEMWLMLPSEDREFSQFIEEFSYASFKFIESAKEGFEFTISFPKVNLIAKTDLGEVMKRIGCPVGLCENASDGGNGSGSKPFLKQTATINIDEYGARVASVSSSGGLWALPPAALQLNRPFLYLIRETSTGVILYIGAIVQL